MKVKIRRIGNSLGIILPKDVLNILKLKEGDNIDIRTKGGELTLTLKSK